MKNKFLHKTLIFAFFNLLFLISANTAEAGVVDLCSGGWDCAFFDIGVLVIPLILVSLLLFGLIRLYKTFKQGARRSRNTAIIVVISILIIPIIIGVIAYLMRLLF